MDSENRYNIGTTTVEGLEFEVYVTGDGEFQARFDGELFRSDGFSRLRSQLSDAVLAARLSVPFVGNDGTPGVMRGLHAGNRDILVTWHGGSKGRMSDHMRVFPADAMSDEEFAELRALRQQVEVLRAKIATFEGRQVSAREVFKPAFVARYHEDPFTFGRHTGQREVA